jgi:UDP-GlcNAc:undecaprenyl-phosphate GlcNAc-1-phosphate transferase
MALLAFAIALVLTPVAGLLARRLNILDHPDQHLKKHERPVPYLGGLAVYAGFMAALIVFKIWERGSVIGVTGVLAGTTLIMLLGLVDDKYKLSPAAKFMGQILAALILVFCNMRIRFVHEPIFSALLSIFWVVGVTNAMNLIDIMDGLSSGVSIIASIIFFTIALHSGRFNDMYISAALGGAVLGFLPYNFPKARIYLGDTGALMLGFVLAAVAMGGGYSGVNPLAVLSPLLILAIPIFDTLFIMFLRHRRGVSMFRGSPDHLALRMVKLGLTRFQTVMILWLSSGLLGLLAFATTKLSLQYSLFIYLTVALLALFAGERMGSFPMEVRK